MCIFNMFAVVSCFCRAEEKGGSEERVELEEVSVATRLRGEEETVV